MSFQENPSSNSVNTAVNKNLKEKLFDYIKS